MRIKQKILAKYKPFYSYKRKIVGYNVTVDLYNEPFYCVNIIKEKDNTVSRTCYPIAEYKFNSYIIADKIYKNTENNNAFIARVKDVQDNNSDILIDKFLNNVIKGVQERC